MLLVLKVMVELRHARQQQKPLRLAHQRRHTTQHMVAGCYFCGYMRVLRPSILEGMRVGVCQKCAASLRLSRRGREHYGCVLLRLGAAADVQHKRCMISLLLRHMVAPIINAGLIEEPCSGLL
jgi:hypothetical protein